MHNVSLAFDTSLSSFQSLYSSFKDVDSFKLAWPSTEPEALKFLDAADQFHSAQAIHLPRLVNAMALDSRTIMVKAVQSKRAELAAIRAAGPTILDPRAAKKAAKAAEKARLLAEAEENDGSAKGPTKKAIKKAAKKEESAESIPDASTVGSNFLDSILPKKGKASLKKKESGNDSNLLTAPPSPALSATATSPTFLPASPHAVHKSEGASDPEVLHL
jgi:hypothetical protein